MEDPSILQFQQMLVYNLVTLLQDKKVHYILIDFP